MGLAFLSSSEIIETSCSLERVRYAIARNLRSPGVFTIPNGSAVGVIEGNHFRLHFKKPDKNFWRPEFKGSISATNDHVTVVVWCGLSLGATVATGLYFGMLVLMFFCVMADFSAGHKPLDKLFGIGVFVLFNFALLWTLFWNEFQHDRIQMKSILDSIEREGPRANE